MLPELKPVFDLMTAHMDKAINHAKVEFNKIRAGKASPAMLDGLTVEYYGSPVPLQQVSSVNTPDARTIVIQPWEKNVIPAIEKSIINSNLGFNPQNDGNVIIISVPPLTTERRTQLVKQLKGETEAAKIGVRNARKEANETLKKMQKDGLAEDAVKAGETDIQKQTDAYIKKVDDLTAEKEKEIMTI
jgi:ribosome recycling factor